MHITDIIYISAGIPLLSCPTTECLPTFFDQSRTLHDATIIQRWQPACEDNTLAVLCWSWKFACPAVLPDWLGGALHTKNWVPSTFCCLMSAVESHWEVLSNAVFVVRTQAWISRAARFWLYARLESVYRLLPKGRSSTGAGEGDIA